MYYAEDAHRRGSMNAELDNCLCRSSDKSYLKHFVPQCFAKTKGWIFKHKQVCIFAIVDLCWPGERSFACMTVLCWIGELSFAGLTVLGRLASATCFSRIRLRSRAISSTTKQGEGKRDRSSFEKSVNCIVGYPPKREDLGVIG